LISGIERELKAGSQVAGRDSRSALLTISKVHETGNRFSSWDTLLLLCLFFLLRNWRLQTGRLLPKDRSILSMIFQPILSKNCYGCHGPDKQEKDLTVGYSIKRFESGIQGQQLFGKSAESRMIRLVAGLRKDLVMP